MTNKKFTNNKMVDYQFSGIYCRGMKITRARLHNQKNNQGAAAYQLGNTSSRTITEVKQRCAWLVLGWVTVQVLPECCC